MSAPTAVIVGAGLAGSLMACYLARQGWRVTVCERRSDPRAAGFIGGRSINLALSIRGRWALQGVGLEEAVLRDGIAMPGRMIHRPVDPATGRVPPVVFQPYSANPGDANYSVSRSALNLSLLHAAAAHDNVSLHFDMTCLDVDPAEGTIDFHDGDDLHHRMTADLVIGADGAYSAVRQRLVRMDRFDFSQSYLEHGYKELTIPPARQLGLDARKHDGFALEPHALHIWPRGGAMMIALPNADRTFTCTLFWPMEGEHGLTSLRSPPEVSAWFAKHYADAAPLMPHLTSEYLANPNGSLVTIRCRPWSAGGRVVLIGDAAHAIVPFYGQGMNAAFEDCRILAELLGERGTRGAPGIADAIHTFERQRKPDADAIADMAISNFIEMRDKVGTPDFLYRKRIEQTLHSLRPDMVTPQYNLVCFSTTSYAHAQQRGAILDRVIDRITHRLPRHTAEHMSDVDFRSAVARLFDEADNTLKGSIAAVDIRGEHDMISRAIIDISPSITPSLAVWPGDTPVSREVLCDLSRGDTITLSTLRATVHLGAHADGPNHYVHPAPGIGERSLHHYIGPCDVVEARVARGARVSPADLQTPIANLRHPRILIRTNTYPDSKEFNKDFAGLSVELIDALDARGVITIGIDTPSVDLFESKDLPAHHAIARHDMAILEGLVLAHITPGEYELIALPLALVGFDASPVRAILRPWPTPA